MSWRFLNATLGKDGSDAKAYQEKDVNNALQRLEEIKNAQEEEKE